MKICHLVHHNDLDGYCSAAIALNWLESSPIKNTFKIVEHLFTYAGGLDFDQFDQNDSVYLMDCTPDPEDFKALMEIVGVDSIVWIDHHKTNIDKVKSLPVPTKRLLSDTYPAACLLTWRFLRGEEEAPEFVTHVSQWDTFTHGYDDGILDFIWGARAFGLENDLSKWAQLFEDKNEAVYASIAENGCAIRQFESEQMKSRLKSHGFDVRVPTRFGEILKGKALNIGKVNSFAFESCEGQGYDVFVPFYWDGRQWTISMYAPRDRQGAVHLGQQCAELGGGGHENAAGYQAKTLPEWLCVG